MRLTPFMYMRHLICITLAALTLVSCSRDPKYLRQKYLDSGNKYYEQKRYKEANIMYQKAIKEDRKFGPAYYHLALVDLKLEQVANAYQALRRAYELLPKTGKDSNGQQPSSLPEIILMSASSQQDPAPMLPKGCPAYGGPPSEQQSQFVERHKLKGDIALLSATAAFRTGNPTETKTEIATAIQEYSDIARRQTPGDLRHYSGSGPYPDTRWCRPPKPKLCLKG